MTTIVAQNEIIEESVRTRYFAKFAGGIISAAAGLGQQALLSRTLGPVVFGQMNFVFSHFESIFSMVDMGVSAGTAARIAQKPEKSIAARKFFLRYFFATTICVFFYALLTKEIPALNLKIWPGIDSQLILPGFFYAVFFALLLRFMQFTDAMGIAKSVEKLRVTRSILTLTVLSVLFAMNFLNAINVHIIIILLAISFAAVVARIFFILKHTEISSPESIHLVKVNYIEEKNYLLTYCKPLVAYSIFGALFSAFDRWILQYSSGSIEQSFFALALQLANICFVFTGPFTGILHREVAQSFANGQIEKLRFTFLTGTRRLFTLSAIIACFMSLNAREIITLLSGDKYTNASTTMTLMFLYPIQQMYGQISSLCLLATGQTKLYMKIGILTVFLSSIFGYFLMGKSDWILPGLNLGSSGLAIKYLGGQFLLTTLLNIAISRQAKFSYYKFLCADILIFVCFYSFAFGVRSIGLFAMGLTSFGLLGLAATGGIYLICSLSAILIFAKFFCVPQVSHIFKKRGI